MSESNKVHALKLKLYGPDEKSSYYSFDSLTSHIYVDKAHIQELYFCIANGI